MSQETHEDLRKKLRKKLAHKKLERQSEYSRFREIEDLHSKLKKKKLPQKEKNRIRQRIKLLEDIGEKIYENSAASEYPSYD